MAGTKISQLPVIPSALALTDIFPNVQPAVGGVTYQATLNQLLTLFRPNILLTYNGNPNSNVAGTAYQLLWDTADSILYECTTTGSSGTAVWTAIGGSGAFLVTTNPNVTTGFKDTNGNNWIGQTATASAVNYVNITDAAASGSPVISAVGTDSNIILKLNGKGTAGAITQGSTSGGFAQAGYVGEVIKSVIASGSAVSLTSTVISNVTSISLTAGNWKIYGNVSYVGNTGNITDSYGWISSTSATLPDASVYTRLSGVTSAAATLGYVIPSLTVSINSTTTYYLSCLAAFSMALTACGGIYAVRLP